VGSEDHRRLAYRLCAEALQAYLAVLPEDHPVALTARLTLATAYEREAM
jgi:hypothetical protein